MISREVVARLITSHDAFVDPPDDWQLIGEGSYRAVFKRPNADYVVKIPRADGADHAARQQYEEASFFETAELPEGWEMPITFLYEFVVFGRVRPVIVMEYVNAITLDKYVLDMMGIPDEDSTELYGDDLSEYYTLTEEILSEVDGVNLYDLHGDNVLIGHDGTRYIVDAGM